jgi:GntR family transcriptional regulator
MSSQPLMPQTSRAAGSGQRGAPLYRAIYDALRGRIGADEWEVGAAFPSEAELSAAFGASRITVRHALRLLEADGYIRKTAARRSVLVAVAPHQHRPWIVRSVDDIIAQVADARLRVLSWKAERSPENAELLGLPPREPLPCLRSVLERDGQAFQRSIIYFPPAIGARLSAGMFDDVIVFRVLGRELGVVLDDVTITVWPELAQAADVAQLGCASGEPLLVTQLRYFAGGGRPIEVAYSRRTGPEARFSTRISSRPQSPLT